MTADKTIKVRVSDRWRVVHDGKPYVKGDGVEVPDDVAAQWLRQGWVQEVKATAPRKKS
jgi:hypothetical protein